MQKTINSSIEFEGTGLHSGEKTSIKICPAPTDHGIVFVRTDLQDNAPQMREIPALWPYIQKSERCTKLQNFHGTDIRTIEHIMAAFLGCGVNNARILCNGAEIPIMDGSARDFAKEILKIGLKTQNIPLYLIKVLKPVYVENGAAQAMIEPADRLYINFSVNFVDDAVGEQSKAMEMINGNFIKDIANSRTFGQMREIQDMQDKGLIRGGSYDNAVIFDGMKIITPGGLRHADEPVRHKILDAMGDLYLAGAPLIGHYKANKGGHATTHQLVKKLMEDKQAWEKIECGDKEAALLSGSGITNAEIEMLEPLPIA